MENDLESKSGDDFVLPEVHPPDGEGTSPPPAASQEPMGELAEPDRKKARTGDDGTTNATSDQNTTTQRFDSNEGRQMPQSQQMQAMASPPGAAAVYPAMGGFYPMMMMMNPQMYGYPNYFNNSNSQTVPVYPSPDTNIKSKKGKEEDSKEAGQAMQPGAAGQMYNPYMMQMQQFQGMMNAMYGRPGYQPVPFNGQSFPAVAPAKRGIGLALSIDSDVLSEYQVLVRQQLEIFEAAPEDVESNTQGRKKQVVLGQVGLRCVHCAPFPVRARGRGAVYYPAKLNGIYQAAQNMAGSHLCQSCQQIPLTLRSELCRLRDRRDNASGGKQYWADGCVALGVYETDGNGLRMRKKSYEKGNADGGTSSSPDKGCETGTPSKGEV